MKNYWKNRVYLRGTTWLGILNTTLGTLFNIVIVRHVDDVTEKTIKFTLDKGTNHPPRKKITTVFPPNDENHDK